MSEKERGMSDIRERMAEVLWEKFGAEPTAPLAAWLDHQDCVRFADAILAEFDVTPRGVHNHDIDPSCPETRLPDGSLSGECNVTERGPVARGLAQSAAGDARSAISAIVLAAMGDAWSDSEEYSALPGVVADLMLTSDWLAEVRREAAEKALREAASAAVTEGEGIPWDHDHDRATVSAWLEGRADRIEKEADRG